MKIPAGRARSAWHQANCDTLLDDLPSATMRILYIDIDSLRPDHLQCYGYHRDTSPNIDRIAAQGVRFSNVHVSDAPCLPSRTALFSGRAGIHTGVVDHGGVAAEPFADGPNRQFRSVLASTSWMRCLRRAGLKTCTISPFGERHSAWHWYANFNEVYNTGKNGFEMSHEVQPVALDWIKRNGNTDDWFLHVNLWDPHTPYRTPMEFGDPFKNEPLPEWLTEEVRQGHYTGVGPHSAREICGYDDQEIWPQYPRQPIVADSMKKVRMMFDGYDTGVHYADAAVGRIIQALEQLGVLEQTIVIISSDHGENLGELNVYGDHQLADQITTRVPLIVRWPRGLAGVEVAPRVDNALHYQFDFAATLLELLGQKVPANWDGRSFASDFAAGRDLGRDFLVVSQCAWSCQRSVRFDDYLCIRSYHDGYHGFPDVLLFDVKRDPHELMNLAEQQPGIVQKGMAMLDAWQSDMMRTASHGQDPLWAVMQAGGAYHTRGELSAYLQRLRSTGRAAWAEQLRAKHPNDQ